MAKKRPGKKKPPTKRQRNRKVKRSGKTHRRNPTTGKLGAKKKQYGGKRGKGGTGSK